MNYDINTFVDKIFYINMDKDSDRNQNMLEQFRMNNITNFERISGVVIDDDIELLSRKYKIMGPFSKDKDKDKYLKGAIGCLLSHKKIIELAKERKYKKILILEDDIYFCENFIEKFNTNINDFIDKNIFWDILYLGLSEARHQKKNTFVYPNIMKIRGGGVGTHAYIIKSKIFDYILDNINYLKIEIDLVYNTLNNLSAIHSYKFRDNLVKVNSEFVSNIS